MTTQTTTNESFDLPRRLVAELVGTFLLVFGGTGSAVFAATFPATGIGFLGVALAFGLTVLAGIYAFGPISGAHFNPAVTIGLCFAGRFRWKQAPAYIAVQVAAGILASMMVLFFAAGAPAGYDPATQGLAANGYGIHSPGGYGLIVALLSEIVLTFVFLSVIIGATAPNRPAGFAGIPIGLTLTLVHLVGIPITNLSVNPARSTGPAVFAGGWALDQLWLFWLAPLAGAMIAGLLGAWLYRERTAELAPAERAPVTALPAAAGSA